jgi:hypothetical protein
MLMLKLTLHLFQENKSYGVKTICIHPLMSRCCTSHHHIWHKCFVGKQQGKTFLFAKMFAKSSLFVKQLCFCEGFLLSI